MGKTKSRVKISRPLRRETSLLANGDVYTEAKQLLAKGCPGSESGTQWILEQMMSELFS